MGKKYYSKLTAKLIPDKSPAEQINLKIMSVDDMLDLFADTKQMEALGKKINGYMKQALLARLPKGKDELSNDNFRINVTESAGRVTYDYKGMTEEMGDNFMQKFMKQGDSFNTVKLTRLT